MGLFQAQKRRAPVLPVLTLLGLGVFAAVPAVAQSLIFNGGFHPGHKAWPRPSPATVASLRTSGWTCPDSEQWPSWLTAAGSNVTFEVFPDGGKPGHHCRLRGTGGSLTFLAYSFNEWDEQVKEAEKSQFGEDHIFTVWVRGRGVLRVSFEAFGEAKEGEAPTVEPPPALTVNVNSDAWVRYRHVIHADPDVARVHPVVSIPEGEVDLDELTFWRARFAQVPLVKEQGRLYGTGALIEDKDRVVSDAFFFERAAAFESAVKAFRSHRKAVDQRLAESLDAMIDGLAPYALTENVTTIQASLYNDIISLTRILMRLAGQEVGEPVPVTAATVNASPVQHKPGVRPPGPARVRIKDVRSDRVRYDENATARTTVTIVNKTESKVTGKLVARMILDLDTTREVKRNGFAVGAGEEKKWSFVYNVGPETYGRALEVRFEDKNAKLLDTWQEYYAVAAEFFRVQQHTHNVSNDHYEVNPWISYFNQAHYFASEPTDAGVRDFDAEVVVSHADYHINHLRRQAEIHANRKIGISSTFYQIASFNGQMGFEVARQHPEYVIYDANGQFALDPIYGGYPNPMQLASPLEVGPRRKNMKVRPHLDLVKVGWQHIPTNWAREDAVVFQANCVKEYARIKNFAGVYVDGNMGVHRGYNYEGTRCVPSGEPQDFANLGQRNHKIFSDILKEENPNFGTWFNWGRHGVAWMISKGISAVYGSGLPESGDVVDDSNLRTAVGYKNVMILDEMQNVFHPGDDATKYPEKLLDRFLGQRDYVIQKYGANAIVGYIFAPVKADEPGLSKWGWPTVNYFMSILTATQLHHAGGFHPSYRPSLQFLTRFSRLIWARDIKAVPVDEVERTVALAAPEKLWWKRLVYRRETARGQDWILHLVRIPPTEKWDIDWVDEPSPLTEAILTVDIGSAKLLTAQACRPYHFEEEQQVVQRTLVAKQSGGAVTFEIPPFRYHTMVVVRLAND